MRHRIHKVNIPNPHSAIEFDGEELLGRVRQGGEERDGMKGQVSRVKDLKKLFEARRGKEGKNRK